MHVFVRIRSYVAPVHVTRHRLPVFSSFDNASRTISQRIQVNRFGHTIHRHGHNKPDKECQFNRHDILLLTHFTK